MANNTTFALGVHGGFPNNTLEWPLAQIGAGVDCRPGKSFQLPGRASGGAFRAVSVGLAKRGHFISRAELPEMMIEMLISEDGPFERSHVAEEDVGVGGTLAGTSRRKAIDRVEQSSLLGNEIPLVPDDHALVSRHIRTNGFL